MTKLFTLSLAAIGVASLLSLPAPADPDKSEAVARVFEVKGNDFQFHHTGNDKWAKGKVEMPGFVKDHFKTDGSTVAGLELLIGGRVGLKENTEIELLNEGEAGTVEGRRIRKIVLNNGGLWAKFAKQDKPLKIQTRGGVMGIKGTEFAVETQENGTSSVTLLEGQVEYQDTGGQTHEVHPGEKLIEFEKDDKHYCIQGEPSEVDKVFHDILNGVLDILTGGGIGAIQARLSDHFYAYVCRGLNVPIGSINALNYNTPGHMPTSVFINTSRTNAANQFSPGLLPNISNFSTGYSAGVPNWNNWSPVYIPWPSINIPRPRLPF